MVQNFIMRPCRIFALRVCVFALAGLLIGCSALRLGYSNGESIVYWWLHGYVDLEAGQESKTRAVIGDLFAWHRKTQLPEYAQLLVQVRQLLSREAMPVDVLKVRDELKGRMLAVIDRALPALADLALSLEPRQITHIEQKFASNNENYRKEYLRGDLEDRQSLRYKKVMKQAEYWFGRFSPEQEARIRAASDARPLDNAFWMAERMRRQRELITLLTRIHAQKPGRDATVRMLREYVTTNFEGTGNEANRAFLDASTDGMAQMVALIVNIATPEQKAHAAKRLQEWIADFQVLGAK